MKKEDVKVGAVYKINTPNACLNSVEHWTHTKSAKYLIKVKQTLGTSSTLIYDVLDDNEKIIGHCECFQVEHIDKLVSDSNNSAGVAIGQKYRVVGNTCSHDKEIGDIVEVYSGRNLVSFHYKEDSRGEWYINLCDVELIKEKGEDSNNSNNKKSFMSTLTEKFTLALTKEPQKTFRKVGITNGDDILTDDGQKVFLAWLLNAKFADDFKKDVADGMLKDLEEKK